MTVTDVRMGMETIRNGIVAMATHVGSITSSELMIVNQIIHVSISEPLTLNIRMMQLLENHE